MQPTNMQLVDKLLIERARHLYQEKEQLTWERSVLLRKKESLETFAKNNKRNKGVYLYGIEIHALTEACYIRQVLISEGASSRESVKHELIRRGLATASTLYAVIGVWERG